MTDDTRARPSRRTLLAGMALMAAARAGLARAEGAVMNNVVLLGDSIFDNKAYVGSGPDVIAQLRAALPPGWTATLNARDGSTTSDIAYQLEKLPEGATHLVVSVGGNNALEEKDYLEEKASSVAKVLDKLSKIESEFEASYRTMLDGVLAAKLPTAVCTIYKARYQNLDQRRIAATGLTVFNDVITREAFARGLPVIDLRLIFNDDADYANDVEPSVVGGAKIARAIVILLTTHDFAQPRSVVYAG
jgi:hypothetical protein